MNEHSTATIALLKELASDALVKGEVGMAQRLERKIYQIIQYYTNIPT